jgi:hypothetical protein
MAPKVIHVGTTLITERCYSFSMMLFEVIREEDEHASRGCGVWIQNKTHR